MNDCRFGVSPVNYPDPDPDLSKLWNTMYQNERKWIKCTGMANKRNLKAVFIDSRKQFDRAIQWRKRQYWQETQQELLQTCYKGNARVVMDHYLQVTSGK